MANDPSRPWWQAAVIYQVYPRSFQDTTTDGVGDLAGIEQRLDHLVILGVDALWISPFYPSPMADFGYDVANYTGVDPLFGTLAHFDSLLAAAHARSLRVILDFVPNHTSDQHPWFLASRSSRTDPKRDWYLWRDAAPGGSVPNNWPSNFGGPAWTFDDHTQQYYLHSFLPQQPDLNWRNPQVQTAIFNALRFWLDKGVDGFRMDVLWLLIKDDQFRDNPPNPDYHGGNTLWSVLPKYTANQPETHTIVRNMRALLETYPSRSPGDDRLLIGEIYLPIDELVTYYGQPAPPGTRPAETGSPDQTASPSQASSPAETGKPAPRNSPDQLDGAQLHGAQLHGAQLHGAQLDGAQLPFNFWLIQTAWQAPLLAKLIRDYEAALPAGAWPNWVLGNHDQSRLATRIGAAQARVAAVLLLTLRGTPTLYYGDELGLPDAHIAPNEVRDPAELRQPGIGQGRDPERSPMPWNWSENAGFTAPGARTWLPLVEGWPAFTVHGESEDPHSLLTLYRTLLQLRRQTEALHAGDIADVRSTESVLTYTRGGRFQVHLNLSDDPQPAPAPRGILLLTSLLDQAGVRLEGEYFLRPNEAIVLELDDSGVS